VNYSYNLKYLIVFSSPFVFYRRKTDFFFLLQSKDSSYRPPFRDGSLLDSSTFHPSVTS